MTVQINRSDHLIGSNWTRKGNPERSTVGRVLPTMGRVLPTMGRVLPTVGCPPRTASVGKSRTLAQNVWIFIARLLRRSDLVFYLNLVGPTDNITKMHKIRRKTAAYY